MDYTSGFKFYKHNDTWRVVPRHYMLHTYSSPAIWLEKAEKQMRGNACWKNEHHTRSMIWC